MRKEIKELLQQNKLDAVFSLSYQTRLWFTGFNSSAGQLLIASDHAKLIIDGRYYESAKKEAKNVEVIEFKPGVKYYDGYQELKRIGIEKEYATIQDWEAIKKLFPNAELIPFSATRLRIIKTDEEAQLIRKAGQIALSALDKVETMFKPGVTENEIDAELTKQIRLTGGEKNSFDAIVASGKRSSLPHGTASDKALEDGDMLTIDFGAVYKGYCSDITRTFHIGKLTNEKLIKIDKILREAQKMGIEAVKPGITTKDVDAVCRDYISSKGYGEYFVHSTGHGLGIDVHELPIVSSSEAMKEELKPGMVITVEPGIYIPGVGGIRVEDDILVTKDGYEVLSKR